MPKEEAYIEQHSEEVQDIMGRIPGSLTRWGLTVIFLIFIMVILGSYFFTFREVVSAPMVITTGNPPAPLMSKATGRIARWYVSDGQYVRAGDPVALISNPANEQDMLKLEQILGTLDTSSIKETIETVILPEKLILGASQETWNQFYSNMLSYKEYLHHDFLPRKIHLLEQEIEKQRQYYMLSLEQQKMLSEELSLTEKDMERYKQMMEKGGVSESQMDAARNRVSQSRRSYTSFEASLKSIEINLIAQQRNLLEMQEQHRHNIAQYNMNIDDNIRSLKNQLSTWKDMYLMASPVNGTVTLTRFWSENHVVSAGERLATVVPEDSRAVICRAAVPSNGIGKVEVGQKVNIKLSGFPYMEHGILTGTVNAVSLVPEENHYVVEIIVKETMRSTYREQLRLVQEMEGIADIITRETRLLIRFVTPLKLSGSHQ